jgi:hypothetical protein
MAELSRLGGSRTKLAQASATPSECKGQQQPHHQDPEEPHPRQLGSTDSAAKSCRFPSPMNQTPPNPTCHGTVSHPTWHAALSLSRTKRLHNAALVPSVVSSAPLLLLSLSTRRLLPKKGDPAPSPRGARQLSLEPRSWEDGQRMQNCRYGSVRRRRSPPVRTCAYALDSLSLCACIHTHTRVRQFGDGLCSKADKHTGASRLRVPLRPT